MSAMDVTDIMDTKDIKDTADTTDTTKSFGWNLQHSYKTLPSLFYKPVKPIMPQSPELVMYNSPLSEQLGINDTRCEVFSGKALPYGAEPIATAYAGYQFGHFAMLGDGRALILGEQIDPSGQRYDIQLKGSGKTPYSRGGDGLAAIGPMLREYIISHAMASLNIPTTLSLAVALTGNTVQREDKLKGAVLTRVAKSHIRVGTFNFAAAFGSINDVKALADYTIWRHFNELENLEDLEDVEDMEDARNTKNTSSRKNKYLLFFRKVCKLQAQLIANWQLVGFVHGVMNTDNMSICGETIDYGPCALMDIYNPNTVFSSIDTNGRYAYKNQPNIGAWNLARLAESLLPLFDKNEGHAIEMAKDELKNYWFKYDEYWLKGMCAKLGLSEANTHNTSLENPANQATLANQPTLANRTTIANLSNELLEHMAINKLDFTSTFRGLCHATYPTSLNDWYNKWQKLNPNLQLMKLKNPAVVPRNHHVEESLLAAQNNDYKPLKRLMAALSKPFDDNSRYSSPPLNVNGNYKTFCGT